MRVLEPLQENLIKTEQLSDGSTVETYDNGMIMYLNKEGKIHRDNDLPAAIDPVYGIKYWYKNGEKHRENYPAVVYKNGNTIWYKNDKKHRINGPAVDWKNTKRWYVNGEDITDVIKYYMNRYQISYPFVHDKNSVAKLNSDKSKILKNILSKIKEDGSADIMLPLIHMFKIVGVTWPELDMIQKSGEADLTKQNTLNESVGRPINKSYIEKLIQALTYSDYIGALDGLISFAINQNYSRLALHNLYSRPDIEDLFVKWCEANIKNTHYSLGSFTQLLYILVQYDIMPTWSKLTPFLNERKSWFLKELLRQISDGAKGTFGIPTHTINVDIEVLRQFGANWPELDIIEKSINNGIKPPSHFNESIEDYENHIIVNPDRYYGKFKIYFNKLLDTYEDEGGALEAIDFLQYKFNDSTLPFEIVNDMLNKAKPKIIKGLLKYMISDDEHKLAFIDVENTINTLRELKCVWPELNIIEKSVIAERPIIETDEDFDSSNYENIEKIFNEYIAYDVFTGLSYLKQKFAMHHMSLEAVTYILNKHKHKFVKYLLSQIVSNSGYGIWNVMQLMKYFDYLSCTWPELVIIRKSINAEEAKHNHSNIDETKGIKVLPNQITLKSCLNQIENGDVIIGLYQLETIAKLRNMSYDVISEKLSGLKNNIIKYYLNILKESEYDLLTLGGIRRSIAILHEFGQYWPELYIIKKSIKIEMTRLNQIYNDDLSIYDLLDEDENSMKNLNNIRSFKDLLYGYFLNKNGYVNNKIVYNLDLHSKEFAAMMNHNRPGLVDYILDDFERNLSSWEYPIYNLTRDIQAITCIKECGLDWWELIGYIDDNKKEIIQNLLQRFKESFSDEGIFDSGIDDAINALKQIVNWSELDVILKSLQSEMDNS